MAAKPHRWMVLWSVATLALAACSSGSGVQVVEMSSNDTSSPAATTTTDATDTTDTTDTTDETATTEPEFTATTGASADTGPDTVPDIDPGSLLPMGDPAASGFTYESSYSGVMWSGYIAGVYEPANDEYNEEVGTCVVVLGTLTPTELTTGVVSPAFDAPAMNLIAGGEQVDSTGYQCDVTDIEAAGYRSTSYASLTVGTSFAFYTEFFVPGPGAALDAVAVGDPTEDGATYFAPKVVTAVPAPPEPTFGPLDVTLAPVGEGAASAFTFVSPYGSTDWTGAVLGAVESPTGEYTDVPGRCVTVYGTITPTKLGQGKVSTGYDSPTVSLIVGGRTVDAGFQCDATAITAAGYIDLYQATVTVGTSVAFYRQFFLEGDPAATGTAATSPAATINAIGLGDTTTDDAQFFAPTVQTSITPPPAPTIGPLGETLIPTDDPTKAVFSYVDPYSSTATTWDGVLQGLVETTFGQYSDLTGRCLVLVGSITPTKIDDGAVTDGFDVPPISIIANGQLIQSTSFECDTTAIEAAGYHDEFDAAVSVGTRYAFSLGFVLADPTATIDAIVVGDPSGDDATYFSPLVLPAVPTNG